VLCPGSAITLTASAGASYLWNTGATQASIEVVTPGTYSVQITGDNGCSSTTSGFVISDETIPQPTITANGPLAFCFGNEVTLTCSAGSSYLWSNGETTQSIVVSESGNYTVSVTSSAGCSGTSEVAIVTAYSSITASVEVIGNTTICEGESVTLSASGGDSYTWSNGETTANIVVTETGTYSVTISSNEGCTDLSEEVNIQSAAYPFAVVTSLLRG
jgi:hypothetical protein